MVYLSIVCRNKHFLKEKFSRGAIDGCHHRSCIRNLATSEELVTERASQRIWMTLIRDSESEALKDRELTTLSRSSSMLSGLVFRDMSATAVLKSLAQ